MNDPICDLSDLPASQCACRLHGPKQAPMEVGRSFPAQFSGQCWLCRDGISPGEYICKADGGGYVHENCAS